MNKNQENFRIQLTHGDDEKENEIEAKNSPEKRRNNNEQITQQLKNLIEERFLEVNDKKPESLTESDLAAIHYVLNNNFGESNYDLNFGLNKDNKVFLLCTIPINEKISMISIFSEGFFFHRVTNDNKTEEMMKTDDIIYIDNNSKKAVSISELTDKKFNIEYKCSEINGNNYHLEKEKSSNDLIDNHTITIPVPGLNNMPDSIKESLFWHLAKKIEPAILLHQIKHIIQNDDEPNLPKVEREREAWAYALEIIRKLKNEQLELLNGIKEEELLSRIELDLISYDFANISNDEDFFSKQTKGIESKYQKNALAQKISGIIKSFGEKINIGFDFSNGHSMKMLIVLSALLKQIYNDSSILKDSLLNNKTKKLTPIPLNNLLV